MKTFAPFWIAAVLFGCGPRSTGDVHGEYENDNNGLDGQLTFTSAIGFTVGTGQTLSLKVSHGREGASFCEQLQFPKSDPTTGLPSGSTYGDTCAVAPSSPVSKVLRATCSTPDCTVTIQGDRIDVRADSESRPEVVVTAALENGREVTDRIVPAFVDVTSFGVECSKTFPCPSNHALFVKTAMQIRPFARSKWNTVPVQLTATPADLVVFDKQDPRDAWSWVGFVKPGKVTLTATAGTHVWTRVIEIVSPSDVVSGALHLRGSDLLKPDKFGSDYVEMDADIAGPLATDTKETMILLWTLKNGSTALDTDVKTSTNTAGWYTTNYWSSVGVYALTCKPGPVQVTATMGSVQAAFALEGTCDR